jgi:hypothetical protein
MHNQLPVPGPPSLHFGYAVVERYDIAMTSDMSLPVVKMNKRI